MITFRVWDEESSSEEFARSIDAASHYHAAEVYAETDEEGISAGYYVDGSGASLGMANIAQNGRIICVRCPDGELRRFRVGVRVVTYYRALEILT